MGCVCSLFLRERERETLHTSTYDEFVVARRSTKQHTVFSLINKTVALCRHAHFTVDNPHLVLTNYPAVF